MEKELLDKVYLLKETLEESNEVVELNKRETVLNNDAEVIKLCMKKDIIAQQYEDLLKYQKEDLNLIKSKQKELYIAKKEFDEHYIFFHT